MPKIMICIPANNEEATISRTVAKVDAGLSQYFPNADTTIVLADNGSMDRTVTLFEETRCDSKKHVISNTGQGKGSNMKRGIEFASSNGADVLTFIDADLISLESDWLPQLLEPVLHHNIDFLGPRYRTSQGGPLRHLLSRIFAAGLFAVDLPQPTGGEVSISGSLVARMHERRDLIPHDYGVDISLVAIASLCRASFGSVDLGVKVHRERPWHSIGKIVEEVAAEGLSQAVTNADSWHEFNAIVRPHAFGSQTAPGHVLPNTVLATTTSPLIWQTAKSYCERVDWGTLPHEIRDPAIADVFDQQTLSDDVYASSIALLVLHAISAPSEIRNVKLAIVALLFIRMTKFYLEVQSNTLEQIESASEQRISHFRATLKGKQ